jgi:hypothetical protein
VHGVKCVSFRYLQNMTKSAEKCVKVIEKEGKSNKEKAQKRG